MHQDQQQVWLITGAGRGIGAHIARAALQAGHQVAASGRNLEQLRAAYADMPAADIALLELDVTSATQAEATVQATLERFGRIDVLVNNAGYGLLGNFEEVSAEATERQFATNVFGLMHVMRAALPPMRRRRAGHIFNISSVGGALGFSGSSIYCASKYAVEGLSASVALEVARFGIGLTVVEPGFFRTDFLDATSIQYGSQAIEDYADGASARYTYEAYNHQQAGDPARLGAAIVQLAALDNPPRQFLAGSDALGMVTGALQGRLDEIEAFRALSMSTDGDF